MNKSSTALAKNFLHSIISHGEDYSRLKVLRGPAKGTYLNLDIRSQGSYWIGSYDTWILDRVPLTKFLKPGDVAWDCGAFVAYYTAIFRRIVGSSGEIHTFEASPKNADQIRPIINFNKWGNVFLHEFAIGPENSTISFSAEQGGASGPVGLVSDVRKNIQHGICTVRSYGVDELVGTHRIQKPDFIKFDLETGEVFALKNGPLLFKEKRPVILLELHGSEALKAALEFVKTYDYDICDVYDLPADKGASAHKDIKDWLGNYRSLSALFRNEPPADAPHMTLVIPREWPSKK